MTLYQIIDRQKHVVNSFKQASMARCHADVVQLLFPENSYSIKKMVVKSNEDLKIPISTENFRIVNFG